MYEWDTSYYDVGMLYEDRVVRVLSDEKLLNYTMQKKQPYYQLSWQLHREYERRFKKALDITVSSLAIEIAIHFLLWKFVVKREERKQRHNVKRLPFDRFFLRLKEHVEVIDCGERAVDNNRFLWDLMSVFWKRKF